jgi:hypothetical protein
VITSIVYTKHSNETLDLAQSLMTAAEHPCAAMLFMQQSLPSVSAQVTILRVRP